MEDLSELFWDSSIEEIKKGYVYDADSKNYICLICGKSFAKGIIYSEDGIFYEAEKMAEVHLSTAHSSMFEYLLNMNKKYTGLTDHQKKLLNYFYQGYTDSQIVQELEGGSQSTIRNHRFTLKEKEKQAKVFLAIMELLGGKTAKKQSFISIHRSAKMVDERYAITEQENEKILNTYFKEGLEGPLSEFPLKEKRKVAILRHLVKKFQRDKKYTEKEVNDILKPIYDDYVILRRYLIEYGFMERNRDGSCYWLKV